MSSTQSVSDRFVQLFTYKIAEFWIYYKASNIISHLRSLLLHDVLQILKQRTVWPCTSYRLHVSEHSCLHLLLTFLCFLSPFSYVILFPLLIPVLRIRIRENTGSGSFIHKKTPCYSNDLVIKLSKTQFPPNNFLIFDFKCHMMFRFGEKMP